LPLEQSISGTVDLARRLMIESDGCFWHRFSRGGVDASNPTEFMTDLIDQKRGLCFPRLPRLERDASGCGVIFPPHIEARHEVTSHLCQ